jgi:hypothetical protein
MLEASCTYLIVATVMLMVDRDLRFIYCLPSRKSRNVLLLSTMASSKLPRSRSLKFPTVGVYRYVQGADVRFASDSFRRGRSSAIGWRSGVAWLWQAAGCVHLRRRYIKRSDGCTTKRRCGNGRVQCCICWAQA